LSRVQSEDLSMTMGLQSSLSQMPVGANMSNLGQIPLIQMKSETGSLPNYPLNKPGNKIQKEDTEDYEDF